MFDAARGGAFADTAGAVPHPIFEARSAGFAPLGAGTRRETHLPAGDAHALDRAALAAALPITTGLAAFKPLLDRLHQLPGSEPQSPPVPAPAPEQSLDCVALETAAYARGVADGQHMAAASLDEERAALVALAENLEALRPEPSRELALLLAATVDRLVRQIVGEVGVDAALLLRRAEAAAALIAEETAPARLRLHPDDAERLAEATLPCAIVADPSLVPGTVLLETRDGWIEHGPEVALNRLQGALDTLGAPR